MIMSVLAKSTTINDECSVPARRGIPSSVFSGAVVSRPLQQASNDSPVFQSGNTVDIISGKYKGKSGIFERWANVKVWVQIDGKSRCIMPRSVRASKAKHSNREIRCVTRDIDTRDAPCPPELVDEGSWTEVSQQLSFDDSSHIQDEQRRITGSSSRHIERAVGYANFCANKESSTSSLTNDNRIPTSRHSLGLGNCPQTHDNTRLITGNTKTIDDVKWSSHCSISDVFASKEDVFWYKESGMQEASNCFDGQNNTDVQNIFTDAQRVLHPQVTASEEEVFLDARSVISEDAHFFDPQVHSDNGKGFNVNRTMLTKDSKCDNLPASAVKTNTSFVDQSKLELGNNTLKDSGAYHLCVAQDSGVFRPPDSDQLLISTFLDPLQRSHAIVLRVINLMMISPKKKTPRNTMFRWLFDPDRLLEETCDLTSKDIPSNLPKRIDAAVTGYEYQLLSTKVEKKGSSTLFGTPRRLTFQYVVAAGPNLTTINVQKRLEGVANFGVLTARKAAKRLELLNSPAKKSNIRDRDYLILDNLTSLEFEEIEEVAHEGCGFIPRRYIQELLGSHRVGQRTFALQVRIFASRLGVFKGVLCEKPGIEKIQLPSSMRKVGASTSRSACDTAVLLVTKIFPSTTSVDVQKLLAGDHIRDTFTVQKLKKMHLRIFESVGVPREMGDSYIRNCGKDRGRGLEHAYVVGLADPTYAIPEGHIFATGMSGTWAERDRLFVTRFPCTEADDAHLLPVLAAKPAHMSESDWGFLRALPFGGIIFGNPSSGRDPLPFMIAGGDNDGDLYFICWNKTIISTVGTDRVFSTSSQRVKNDELPLPYRPNWLEEAQNIVADIHTASHLGELIGKLHNMWEKKRKDSQRPDDGDACAFGRAFKEALDIGKHGGQIHLPRHLWEEIPDKLHSYLACNEVT